MSRRKRAHLNDYELSEDGGYEYRGTLWRWKLPEKRESFLRAAWPLLGGAVACLVASGFVPAAGVGTTFIVLVPYVTSVIATALAVAALWKLTREGEKIRDHVYHSAVEGLTPRLFVGPRRRGDERPACRDISALHAGLRALPGPFAQASRRAILCAGIVSCASHPEL